MKKILSVWLAAALCAGLVAAEPPESQTPSCGQENYPVLFENGTTRWTVLISDEKDAAHPTLRYAAQELVRALNLISGAEFSFSTMPAPRYPRILVRTSFPGADAGTVEAKIAKAIETELNRLKGLLYSNAVCGKDGSYSLLLTFEPGVDPDLAMAAAQSGITRIEKRLPRQVLEQGIEIRNQLTPEQLAAFSGARPQATKGFTIRLFIDPKLRPEEARVSFNGLFLELSGGDPRGVLYAVYSFLQNELGVRWLWPGADGEFMPKRASWRIPAKLDYRHTPSLEYRGFHLCGDWYKVDDFRTWMARNFVNVHRHGGHFQQDKRGLFHHMWSSHNVHLPKSMFAEHPEYFAERDGKRIPSQVCLNHPEVDRLVLKNFEDTLAKRPDLEILSIFPSDNQEYCQCEKCRAKGVSTSWFDFYNRLTDALRKTHPKLQFSTIAYQGYMDVPKNPVRNSAFVEFASYIRCNSHPYGTPGCKPNERTLQLMKDWAATGVAMGNYGYEFDIFSGTGNVAFAPFYGLIADAVRKEVKLKHVLLMTEVGLSPRNGPPEKVSSVQNRLGEYLYARLMWDHHADWKALLKDWCDTAYGPAAAPMYEYFLTLEAAWNAMPRHAGILGSAVNYANLLLTPEVRKKAEECFLAADRALAKATALDEYVKRCGGNVNFEKVLYSQWLAFLADDHRLVVPARKDAASGDNLRFGATVPGLNSPVRVFWNGGALYFANLSPVDSYRIELNSGVGGETWFFTYDEKTGQKQWKRSTVGVDETNWKAVWHNEKNMAVIPFKSLGVTPAPNDKWRIRLTVNGVAWPEKGTGALQFSPNADAGRSILWWSGSVDRDSGLHEGVRNSFEAAGWNVDFVEKPGDQAGKTADVYYFRNPAWKRGCPFPESEWKLLRGRIAAGATAVFISYSSLPLEKYFGDPSFAVKIHGIGKIQLSERKSRTVYPGVWQTKPYDISRALKFAYTPAYYLVPAKPAAWRVLATLPLNGEANAPECPYLIARPYGKGLVIGISADPRISYPALISNIIANRKELFDKMK